MKDQEINVNIYNQLSELHSIHTSLGLKLLDLYAVINEVKAKLSEVEGKLEESEAKLKKADAVVEGVISFIKGDNWDVVCTPLKEYKPDIWETI